VADDDGRYLLPAMVSIASFSPPFRAVTIVFNPADPPQAYTLLSSASVADLIPRLEAVLVRLKDGSLRMPVDGVRFVDVEEP
jgi:hypothetical protein